MPPYLRRAKSIEELLPWLYLKGISTGDFCEALAALLGPVAPGLSASTIARLKEVWQGELEHWQRRDLSAKRYVYFWADGVYFSPRLDHDKQCMCVIIGADELGRKELLAIADGYRESAQSWREVLLDLKRRGLAIAPELATGDGALGFWKALREVYGTTREPLVGAQDRQPRPTQLAGETVNDIDPGSRTSRRGRSRPRWLVRPIADVRRLDFAIVRHYETHL